MQISYCIVVNSLSYIFAAFINAQTISKMGRKRAILIGYSIQIVSTVMIGRAAHFPVQYPNSFLAYVMFANFAKGYGQSLHETTAFSVINLTFWEERAEKVG